MTTTTRTATFTDEDIAAATAKAETDPGFWIGHSGEEVRGSDVATHLEATLALLEKRGWTRTPHDPTPELPEVDENASVKALLHSLWKWGRTLVGDTGPLTLAIAMIQARGKAGDQDTNAVADRLMNALVAARTGQPFAQHNAWAEKKSRTWDEIRDLLTAAASIARSHA